MYTLLFFQDENLVNGQEENGGIIVNHINGDIQENGHQPESRIQSAKQ